MLYIKEREHNYHRKINALAPYCIVTLLILGVRYKGLTLAALFICAVMLFFCEEKDYIPLLFIMVPFANIFKLSAESTSFFTYVELLFVILHFFRSKRQVGFIHIIIILLSIFACLSEVINQTIDIKRSIKFFSNLVLLTILVDTDNPKEVNKLFKYYIIGFIISGIVAEYGSAIVPIDQYVKTQISRYNDGSEVTRFAGLYPDPNYFTVNIIICSLLSILLYEKKEIKLLTFIIYICMFAYFIGKTGSKSALVMMIIPILVFFGLMMKKRNYKVIIFGLIAIIAFLALMSTGKITIFSGGLRRFNLDSKEGIDQLSTGRYNIWVKYFEYFKSDPMRIIVGNSIGADYLRDLATHNTYIDLIYQLGVIGTLLYIWMILAVSKTNFDIHRKWILSNSAVWVCVLIMYFFLSQLQEFDLPFQIALAVLWNNYDINSSNTQDEEIRKPIQPAFRYFKYNGDFC